MPVSDVVGGSSSCRRDRSAARRVSPLLTRDLPQARANSLQARSRSSRSARSSLIDMTSRGTRFGGGGIIMADLAKGTIGRNAYFFVVLFQLSTSVLR